MFQVLLLDAVGVAMIVGSMLVVRAERDRARPAHHSAEVPATRPEA
ncbi:MAG: hypothetical protein AAF547_11150 [Actinomycetota bacterium]